MISSGNDFRSRGIYIIICCRGNDIVSRGNDLFCDGNELLRLGMLQMSIPTGFRSRSIVF